MSNTIKKSTFILTLVMSCLFTSCNNKVLESAKQEETNLEDQDEIIYVDVEVDEWGCRPAAGYKWSKLKLECVRPFEIGIPLVKAQNKRLNSLGFVIFDNDQEQAELFLPELEESLLIHLQDGVWTDNKAEYSLKKTEDGLYELYSSAAVLLYKSVEK